ncbi:acyl-CoA N-acyltransferase [Xylariaceae sp. AK1471]|nr:acyl-CoA N-acyltransferase [Xylariaceae sp. AK1471]
MVYGHHNPLGAVVGHRPALRPSPDTRLSGRYVTLVGMSPEHIEPFYPHVSGDENAHLWDYMLGGPFNEISEFRAAMESQITSQDMVLYAIIPADQSTTPDGADNIVGCASYLHIDSSNRSVEVGTVMFSPKLQQTPAATEAMYLMAKHAFEDLGYRRYEWKCNTLNAPSQRAALRLGFTFEGTFRQHMIVKGRNRDTAWFAMIDADWPKIRDAFDGWLDPSNFDEHGLQRKKLESFRMT